jgi:hypothetical protein
LAVVYNQGDQKKENESRVITLYNTLPKVEQNVHVGKFICHISYEPWNAVHLGEDACRLKNFGDARSVITEQNFYKNDAALKGVEFVVYEEVGLK